MPFTILDQDGDTIEVALLTPAGTLTVICRVRLDGNRLILYDLHLDGPGPGAFGPRRLRAALQELMEQFDVRAVEIRGYNRTTGARPGRLPPPLVFRAARKIRQRRSVRIGGQLSHLTDTNPLAKMCSRRAKWTLYVAKAEDLADRLTNAHSAFHTCCV